MRINTGVFSVSGEKHEMPKWLYYVLLGLMFMWVPYLSLQLATRAIVYGLQVNTWLGLLVCTVSMILGRYITEKWEHSVFALVGYHLVALPISVFLIHKIDSYWPHRVIHVMFATSASIAIATLVDCFTEIYDDLTMSIYCHLLSIVAFMMAQALFFPQADFELFDYWISILLSCYVAIYMHRAFDIPYSFRNVFRVCSNYYLDIPHGVLNIKELVNIIVQKIKPNRS